MIKILNVDFENHLNFIYWSYRQSLQNLLWKALHFSCCYLEVGFQSSSSNRSVFPGATYKPLVWMIFGPLLAWCLRTYDDIVQTTDEISFLVHQPYPIKSFTLWFPKESFLVIYLDGLVFIPLRSHKFKIVSSVHSSLKKSQVITSWTLGVNFLK